MAKTQSGVRIDEALNHRWKQTADTAGISRSDQLERWVRDYLGLEQPEDRLTKEELDLLKLWRAANKNMREIAELALKAQL